MLSGGLILFALLTGVQAQGCGRTPIAPNTNNKGVRDINNEIVGGVNAVPYSWPWQIVWCVGTNPSTCSLSCGGSIVAPNWIITAGHCVSGNQNNPGRFMVKAGVFDYMGTPGTEQSAQVSQVQRIILHNQYATVSGAPRYDIALVQLATPFTFTNQVQPVCLPSADTAQTNPPSTLWTTGWGTTSSGGQVSRQLKQVLLPTVSNANCQGSYGNAFNGPLMCCAGQSGKDACQGDSGGPLVGLSNNGSWFMYGITSWGQGCALQGYPGVWARTSAFCSWVSTQTGGQVNCAAPT